MDNQNKKKKKGRAGKALFIIEILILVLLLTGVGVYAYVHSKLQFGAELSDDDTLVDTDGTDSSDENLNTDNVIINPEIATDRVMEGYYNIALVGIDARSDADFDYSNSDTMIICSINNDTGEVRLVSVYRDSYLNVDPESYDFQKANAAYCQGSASQFLSMINTNLDLNITDYVAVDFKAVARLVDDVGGITVEMTEEEAVHTNNYCVETSETTGMDYEELPEEAGTYTLNGVQAVSYARIRYTAGFDMKRTMRQRLVIEKIIEKVQEQGLSAVNSIIEDVFPLCKTNLSSARIVKMATQMLGYSIAETTGFPFVYDSSNYVNSEYVVPVTLADNVRQLHEFLFANEVYEPSETVSEYSRIIEENTGLTEDDIEAAKENSQIAASGGEVDTLG